VYILNSEAIKNFYMTKYIHVTGGEYKCLLSDTLFPSMQAFNMETFDWEPIETSFPMPETSSCSTIASEYNSDPVRADTPDELHKQWNAAKPVPQTDPIFIFPSEETFPDLRPALTRSHLKILSRNGKTTNFRKLFSEHLQICEREIRVFNAHKLSKVRFLLERSKLIDLENCLARDYLEYRIQAPPSNPRPVVYKTARTLSWMREIDARILESYNRISMDPEELPSFRLMSDALSKLYASSISALVVRRAILFCKVLRITL